MKQPTFKELLGKGEQQRALRLALGPERPAAEILDHQPKQQLRTPGGQIVSLVCACGCAMRKCEPCDLWVCDAPGTRSIGARCGHERRARGTHDAAAIADPGAAMNAQAEFFPASSPVPPGDTPSWFTPKALVLGLHFKHRFDLDAFGHPESPASLMIGAYFCPPVSDALREPWEVQSGPGDPVRPARVFVNPPYDSVTLALAMEKSRREARRGALVVALVPAWTDRAWWQDHVEDDRRSGAAVVQFLRGRLRFGWPGNPEGLGGDGAMFPSALITWRPQ